MAENDATYKIGQAARILELEPFVLRYWETEFPSLVPIRTEKGQRLYSEEHIDLLHRIKHLLHERGMTIEGARRHLEAGGRYSPLLREIRSELLAIRRLLENS
jgi:DNA-binding transcriptional MerR regulator